MFTHYLKTREKEEEERSEAFPMKVKFLVDQHYATDLQ